MTEKSPIEVAREATALRAQEQEAKPKAERSGLIVDALAATRYGAR